MPTDDRPQTRSRRRFRTDPATLGEARQLVRSLGERVDLPPEDREDLALAVSEAGANAIQHSGSGEWYVAWTAWDGCLDVEVQDDGRFQDAPPPTEVVPRAGRGISLIGALVDRLEVRRGTPARPGTVVRLRKCG